VTDPIDELVLDLERSGKPSLAWVVKWAPDGEHFDAAWKASQAGRCMFTVLERVGWKSTDFLHGYAVNFTRSIVDDYAAHLVYSMAEVFASLAAQDYVVAKMQQDTTDAMAAKCKLEVERLALLLRDETPPTLSELMGAKRRTTTCP
jgi:hypothetical protein